LLEHALCLWISPDILGESFLLTLIKRPDAAEQQRGDGQEVLRPRVIDPRTDLAGVGFCHHFDTPLAGNSRSR
jgi:hypothetical protein